MALYQTGTSISALVGIGTTNPYSKLDVSGAISTSNVTTTSHGVISQNNGEFLSIEAFNSGNTSKLPLALAAYGGNVGIGVTNPQVLLSAVGTCSLGPGAGTTTAAYHTGMVNIIGGGTRALLRIENNNSIGSPGIIFGEGGGFTEDTQPTIKKVQGTNNLAIMCGGKVGINITSPGALFQVNAAAANPGFPTMHIGDNANDYGATYGMVHLVRAATPGDTKAHLTMIRNGQTGVNFGFYTGSNTFGIWHGLGNTSATPAISINTAGQIGIGTASSGAALDIWGGHLRVLCNINGSPNFIQSYNGNSGVNAYAATYVSTDANSCILFKNSSTRADDGGVNNATLRNDGGSLRLCGASNSPNIYLDTAAQAVVIGKNGAGYVSPGCLHLSKNNGVTTQLSFECAGYATSAIALSTTTFTIGAENKDITFRTGCTYNGDYTSTGTEYIRLTQGGAFRYYGAALNMGFYNTTSASKYVGVGGDDTYSIGGMEIENVALVAGYNWSQKIHLRSHQYAVGQGRRWTLMPDGRVGHFNENPNGYATHEINSTNVGYGQNTTLAVSSTSGWISGSFGDNVGGQRVVMGTLGGIPCIGGHTAALNGWSNFGLCPGGSVGVNRYDPGYTFDVSGTIRCTGDIIAYSDQRVKTDLEPIENALDKVSKITGYTFRRTDTKDPEKRHAGVIAQEVLEVLPEVVYKDETEKYNVAYGNLTALLIQALKEERRAREALEDRIKLLEQK